MIKSVDKYQDLLRISVASPSNDHRLGGNEAPPAILSMFLGDDLLEVMEAISEDKTEVAKKERIMDTGVQILPDIRKDTTDRNRTSPFAFTGSRFEFRMAGSMTSVACPTYMLNTITADALMDFADVLEKAEDLESAARALIKETYRKHKRIVFNGNNYSEDWVSEAEKRGLLNLRSTVDALPFFNSDKNVALFRTHKVFSKLELDARQEILYEEYCKLINIEALTMLDMVNKDILPAVASYIKDLSESVINKKAAVGDIACAMETSIITNLSALCDGLFNKAQALEQLLIDVDEFDTNESAAQFFCGKVIPAMKEMRAMADDLEVNTSRKYWPMPTYGDLLFT